MENLRGIVERITYANEETGYSVLKIRCKGYMDLVTIVGNMATVPIGSVVTVKGTWAHNPAYGKQFEVKSWEESLPASIYGIEKYLGSGLIKGIGPVYAKKIVQLFKEETLTILEQAPNRLIEVDGIGKRRVESIKEAWQDQREIKNIMMFLQDKGISTAYGARIYKTYGEESIATMQENPYKLADDIYGIGFKTADHLAAQLGIDKESFTRCRAGIFYTLSELSKDGHCYGTMEQLIAKSNELLEIEEPKLVMSIDYMLLEKELIKEEDCIYLPPFFYSERGIAKRLKQIMQTPSTKEAIAWESFFKKQEQEGSIVYDTIQKEAIIKASTAKIMILTGGPGTGKTTTTDGIIKLFKASQMSVLLAAPTGRAAKRMSETTGMEAKTIHRLLEFKPPGGYKKTEESPLEGDVLIVDEASMIDLLLFYHLLKAIPDTMRVIIVGDIDQLPSVGPGNVLRDLIASNKIRAVKLERIFRQALGSKIITNAHKVNKGEPIELKGDKNSNFFFIEEENAELIGEKIITLCKKRLPTYYKVNPIRDIQVLTPMQKTPIGASHLNTLLQAALNPSKESLQRGATHYKLYDKVMQMRNNYDKEVYNGDIGIITSVHLEDKSLKVNFDGREVSYEILELDELSLAYATTIHKAQGSEYPIVILPISLSHYIMLQRNLLYTGITRAKKIVVLIGTKKAIHIAIQNSKVETRNTQLSRRIEEAFND